MDTNVRLRYNGELTWDAPAITKSSCVVDVSYFPFDSQECNLTFGSWTYNGNQVCVQTFLFIHLFGMLMICVTVNLLTDTQVCVVRLRPLRLRLAILKKNIRHTCTLALALNLSILRKYPWEELMGCLLYTSSSVALNSR